MREPERDFGRLQDIIQAANHIASFTDGYSQEELKDDKLRFFAVVKNVEIIGEAAYMLSLVFKDSHSEIPWNNIIRMRHILVHGYATILQELSQGSVRLSKCSVFFPEIRLTWNR